VVLKDLPVSTEVRLTEDRTALPGTARWDDLSWDVKGDDVTVAPDGRSAVITVTGEGTAAELVSTNGIELRDTDDGDGDGDGDDNDNLHDTGTPVTLGFISLAGALILGGGGLVAYGRRRRARA